MNRGYKIEAYRHKNTAFMQKNWLYICFHLVRTNICKAAETVLQKLEVPRPYVTLPKKTIVFNKFIEKCAVSNLQNIAFLKKIDKVLK